MTCVLLFLLGLALGFLWGRGGDRGDRSRLQAEYERAKRRGIEL